MPANTEGVKTISQLLGIGAVFESYLEIQISSAHSDAERVIRLYSLFEQMIEAVGKELLINQMYSSFDNGVLLSLREKTLQRYFARKPFEFLRLLYQSAKDVDELPLLDGLSVEDINHDGDSDLKKGYKIRNHISHRANSCFEMPFSKLAELAEVRIEFNQFFEAIRKAIHVLHQIYNYVPIAEQDAMNEAVLEPPD